MSKQRRAGRSTLQTASLKTHLIFQSTEHGLLEKPALSGVAFQLGGAAGESGSSLVGRTWAWLLLVPQPLYLDQPTGILCSYK